MFSFFAAAPSSPHPVIHIKEANDHLEALFEQKSHLEKEVDDLRLIILQKEEREKELLDSHEKLKNDYEETILILEEERQTHLIALNDLKRLISASDVDNEDVVCDTEVEYVDQELLNNIIEPVELTVGEQAENDNEDEEGLLQPLATPNIACEAGNIEAYKDTPQEPEVDAETSDTLEAVQDDNVHSEAVEIATISGEVQSSADLGIDEEAIIDLDERTESDSILEANSAETVAEIPDSHETLSKPCIDIENESEIGSVSEAIVEDAYSAKAESEDIGSSPAEYEAAVEIQPTVLTDEEREEIITPEPIPVVTDGAHELEVNVESQTELEIPNDVNPSQYCKEIKEFSERIITVMPQFLQTYDSVVPISGTTGPDQLPDSDLTLPDLKSTLDNVDLKNKSNNELHKLQEKISKQKQMLEEFIRKNNFLDELLKYKSVIKSLALCMDKAEELNKKIGQKNAENKNESKKIVIPKVYKETKV